MKRSLVVLVLAALSSQAALIHFNLSPPGTDVAVGLSPSNSVPALTNSTGSGNTISGGIVFDTGATNLQVAIGYGSAAGFTDLSGPATVMHIHGPATTNENAGVLISLIPFNFTAANPSNGGVIYGNVAVPAGVVSNLLAGFTYVNIHTALNPPGEIRGQLIAAVNSPPAVSCPPNSSVECGTPSMLTAVVSDPDGDALTVVWTLNGTAVQTNTLPAGNTSAPTSVSLTATLSLGTNNVGVLATDSAANMTSCSTTVIVVDTTPPVISNVRAVPNVLWPPNHQFVNVRVFANATDTCGPATWKIVGVTSNEGVNATGSGKTSPDWVITGDHTVKLRVERSGQGNGRVYTISVQARDVSGNLSDIKTVTVTVPHDQGNGKGKRK
jgi:hypothetical protein